jgi:uncharacterized cofD-like protein
MKPKRIVVFGGGSAMPEAVLEPLKKYPLQLTSITSMTDDGGSTGQLRRDFGVLPPGDIRRHILALSEAPKWKKELWRFRFGGDEFEGGHKGHNFGNIFMAGLETKLSSYGEVLDACRQFMMIPEKYTPLPATINKVALCAELENGQIIEGESEIDVPKAHEAEMKIKRVFLKPAAKAYTPTLKAIREADVLIFGPGDLYSSLVPCLLPGGIASAVAKSKARKILICNIMNKRGETGGFTVWDFARELEKYIGVELTTVVYNSVRPQAGVMSQAKKKDPSLLTAVAGFENLDKKKFIGLSLLKKDTLEHDPKKTGKILWKMIN